MSTKTLTLSTFEQQLKEEGILVIDFWASWCAPCRAFAPIFEAAAARHPDLVWAKIDTEAEQELAGALGIRSIPTLMVFRDGVLVFAEAGLLPAAVLDDLVAQVRALDMAEVKRTLARRESETHAP